MPSRVRPEGSENGASGVIDLDAARERHRLAGWKGRVLEVIARNRAAFERLHESGLLFSRHGVRTGREILLAHQHLLRVSDLIARAERGEAAEVHAAMALADEVEQLLEKSGEIARRNRHLFQTSRPGGS